MKLSFAKQMIYGGLTLLCLFAFYYKTGNDFYKGGIDVLCIALIISICNQIINKFFVKKNV